MKSEVLNLQEYKLNRQGYSLFKNKENENIIKELKKELTVKPSINTDFGNTPNSFPIYRESINRLYLPRHFGLKKFGKPSKIIYPNSENIDIPFNGELREIQNIVVNTFIN